MKRPNILLAIADDLAWPHFSAYGCRFVSTPNADRVAEQGALFTNCYTTAPTCTASRASLLTGKAPWQLEEGAQLWGLLPKKYQVYPDILEQAGYFIGLTNKGWGPGSIEASGRTRNPAGPAFDNCKCEPLTSCMLNNDYSANFEDFLNHKPADRPFCFWYGSKEPHRPYEQGSGIKHGKNPADVDVPGYLPDCDEVRSDFLDYALEVERFDSELGKMIALLEKRGELENTIVIVTGDNGFPFPRAKATIYQNGCHVPLAIRWGANCPASRTVTDFVSFMDFAPTLLEAVGLNPDDYEFTGRSFMNVISSRESGRVDASRDRVVTGRERHGYCRPGNVGNPMRSLVTDDFLYIRNFTPDRAVNDVDGSPTRTVIEMNRDTEMKKYYDLCFGPRPPEELYAAVNGPDCIENIAALPEYAETLREMRTQLEQILEQHGDPRVRGQGWIFDCYPYFGRPEPGLIQGFPEIRPTDYQLGNMPPDREKPAVNAVNGFANWS